MNAKIFSGEESQKFWNEVERLEGNQYPVGILYDYGCKAQELEAKYDELDAAAVVAWDIFNQPSATPLEKYFAMQALWDLHKKHATGMAHEENA